MAVKLKEANRIKLAETCPYTRNWISPPLPGKSYHDTILRMDLPISHTSIEVELLWELEAEGGRMPEARERALETLTPDLRHARVVNLIELALCEDLVPSGPFPADPIAKDVTSAATMKADRRLRGRVFSKQSGVVAGLTVAAGVFKFVDGDLDVKLLVGDGEWIDKGTSVLEIEGLGQSMLLAERTALNFFGRLSGIATQTRRYVDAVGGTQAVILDTRKTLPGFRLLDKYAVRMGGGSNHRMGLYDMALIKDNHIDAAGGVESAVRQLRAELGPDFPLEVEVKDLGELDAALNLGVDRILLDNMDPETMREAVKRTAGQVGLEASGNVNLDTVRSIAETGVDFISSGALTHSVAVFDFSMRVSAAL